MRNITTLKDVHTYLPGGFHEVCIEIMGSCNAKCKYCPSGRKNGRGGVTTETFRAIVKKLCEYKIIGEKSQINLFWWGEPTLHPKLNEIISVTKEFQVEYVLSTNASVYQKIDVANLQNIKRFIISMPGFSQDSYDRIHEFDFQTVVNNIKQYTEDFKNAGKLDKIWIAYHIYQFNLDEIYRCYQFCYDLGIYFNPGFAFPLLAKERIQYAKDNLASIRKEEMLKELVTVQLDKMIRDSNKRDCIYQVRNFVVDERANVYGCLNLEHDDENFCGNLLEENIDKILGKIAELSICEECIACGVAPTDMSFKFFYNDWFQMMTIRKYYEDHLSDDRYKELTRVLLLLREFETSKDRNILDQIEIVMTKFHIQWNEVEKLINGYTMRPCELNNLLKGRESEGKVSG